MVVPVNVSRSSACNRAFTLPEMTISVAIVFVMVLVVWGVIGTSQITMDIAVRKSTQARISQQLISDILLNNWSSVMSYNGSEHYFDSEGIRIPGLTGIPDDDVYWAYRARIEVERQQAAVPGVEEKPGKEGGDDGEGPPVMSRRVSIHITNGPYPDYNFQTERRHETFSTWLSKMAKN